MSRWTFILSKSNRELVRKWLDRAPDGFRLEIAEPKRSTDQNSLLWAELTEIARQRPVHNGVKMTPDLWKAVFLQALGSEMVMIPTLNGDGFFPLGHRSSQLSKAEFSNLIELIHAWAAENNITLHDPTEQVREREVA